jgi:hypothetical protein
VQAKAEAEAAVIAAQNEAEVAALRTSVEGFGSPDLFARHAVLARMAPTLGEIFASDESEFGRLFSALLLSPPEPVAGRPTPPRSTRPAAAVVPAAAETTVP